MKKLLSIALALITAASMSVTAFAAAEELDNSPATGNPSGDYSIGVSGKYQAGSTTADPKISVDIAWENMEFTYTAGKTEYDPTTHKTTTKAGAWSTDKKYIEVTNHSNASIVAGFTFTPGDGVTTTGSFYDKSDATTALTSDKQSLTLASGEDKTTEGQTYTTPSGKIYFGVSGDAISENKTLGTITVKIAKEWTTVTTEEALIQALNAGGKVQLGGNIKFTDYPYITGKVTLDLNGYAVTGKVLMLESAAELTVCDGVGTGSIDAISNKGKFTLNSGTVTDRVVNSYGATVTVNGGAITGTSNGLFVNGGSTVCINGGEIAKAELNDSDITITGGTFSRLSLSDSTEHTVVISDGTFTEVNIHSKGVTISGGTFKNTFNIWEGASVTITGGTFEAFDSMGDPEITVAGGTFSKDPTKYVNTNEYTVTNSNGKYTVTAKTAS